MPAQEFRFSMALSGGVPGSAVSHVLVDVFRSVLAHVGVKGEAAERLLDEVMAERRAAPSDGDYTVVFTSHAGEFEILISQAGRDWRTSCPVPIR